MLNPPFLSRAFGSIQAGSQYGCVLRNGYYFRIHLPALTASEDVPVSAVFESSEGGMGLNPVDPSLGEIYWGVYAWPAEPSPHAKSTYFINQDGDVIERSPESGGNRYIGLNGGPAFDAAYSAESPRDMRTSMGIATYGLSANDGATWALVGR